MSLLPDRLEWKAMLPPEGDQSGAASLNVLVVTCDGVPPPDGMTQMSLLPERSDWNAICVPSGDHVGWTSFAASVVSWTGVPPERPPRSR